MRGTLHFVAPDDLRELLAITAGKTVRGMAARHRDLDLTEAEFARARDIAQTELGGGGALARTEFLDTLTAGGVDVAGQRGMHLIWWLAHHGVVCWGPRSGTQQALVLLDEWAPPTREPDRDQSLGDLVLRYVTARGPTTLKDFCWWSKIAVADAMSGLARVRDRLDERELAGTTYLLPRDTPSTDTTPRDTTPQGVRAEPRPDPQSADVGTGNRSVRAATAVSSAHHALPGFDEYLLGYQSRSPALPERFAGRVVPGNNGIFLSMLVSRGAIVGTWKRRITAKALTATLEPFGAINATERRGFERDLERYAAFLGVPLRIVAPDDSSSTKATSSTRATVASATVPSPAKAPAAGKMPSS
jgi:hypothetical protein